jgi:hypothetical protein
MRRDGTKIKCSLRNRTLGTIPALQRNVCGFCNLETTTVVGRQYLTRQATTLLKFAKTVTDPNVAAGLVEKAAELKSQVDEPNRPDKSPRAPDVE